MEFFIILVIFFVVVDAVTEQISTTSSFTFNPSSRTINLHDTIQFTIGQTHNVVQRLAENDNCDPMPGGFMSGNSVDDTSKRSFTHQFNAPGNYYFMCHPHCDSGMVGKIYVKNVCPTPPAELLASPYVVGNCGSSHNEGESCQFGCVDGAILTGETAVLTCLSTGSWSSLQATCATSLSRSDSRKPTETVRGATFSHALNTKSDPNSKSFTHSFTWTKSRSPSMREYDTGDLSLEFLHDGSMPNSIKTLGGDYRINWRLLTNVTGIVVGGGSGGNGNGNGGGGGGYGSYSVVGANDDPSSATAIDIGLTVKTTGWVGFGVGSSMRQGADIVQCNVVNGDPTCYDSHVHHHVPPTIDTTVGGTSQIAGQYNGKEVDGVTTVRFVRVLAAVDGSGYDKPIHPTGPNDIMVSFNPHTDEMGKKHTNRYHAQLRINFAHHGGGGSHKRTTGFIRFQSAHGSLMFIAWGFCIPIGMMVARFGKHWGPRWFTLHRAIQSTGITLTMIAFIIAIVMVRHRDFNQKQYKYFVHAILGLIIFIVVCLVAVFGNVANMKYDPLRKAPPLFPDRMHWYYARLTFLAAIANVFLGIVISRISHPGKIAFFTIASVTYFVMFVAFIVLQILHSKKVSTGVAPQGVDQHPPQATIIPLAEK